jgi:hypothetical protein
MLFMEKHPTGQSCFYCRKRPADSRPYRLDLLKLIEVKLKSGGYRQHNVNYVNQNVSISVPRCRKAFIMHTLNAAIKTAGMLSCLIFLDISSIVWRIIIGMLLGGLLGRMLLLGNRTRSNISYLFSPGLIIRVVIWLICITLASSFSFNPFNIRTTDSIYFVVTSIVIFDSFLMQLINLILGKHASFPLFPQYSEVIRKFRDGYVVYNDVPVLSVIYPLFKWMVG